MKKMIALVLAMVLALGLCACSGSDKDKTDSEQIKEKGKLVIGITDFAPMDYKDENGEWIGFDADMAKKFAESLGVEAEFVEIVWDNKVMELDTRAIDVVWNGMTLTDEVTIPMGTSEPYCNNGQVVIVNAAVADQYKDVESIKNLTFSAENGSAGAKELDALGLSYTAVDTQAKALMEVAAGASDACVIDALMAGAMTGEGTDYPDLTYTVTLNAEEYGVGFRKGSDMVQIFNEFWKKAYDDGTVMSVAETYGVQAAIIEK